MESSLESSGSEPGAGPADEFSCPSSSDGIYDLRNASYEYISSTFFYSTQEQYFIVAFFPLVLSLGLIGNLSFFVVVAKIPGMRTITNAYLINLAVCDILFILVSINDVFVSFLSSPTVRSKSYTSNVDCSLAHGCMFAVHFAADFIIIFMSFERYLAICKPLKHRIMSGAGHTLKLIVFSWSFGILYSFLVVPRFSSHQSICIQWPSGEHYDHLPRYIVSCETSHPVFSWFNSFAMSVPYFTAFLVTSIFYICIIHRMHKRTRQVADIGAATSEEGGRTADAAGANIAAMNREKVNASRNKVAVLLITTGITYFLCFFPYIILRLNYSIYLVSNYKIGFVLSAKQYWSLFWGVTGLGTLNSVVNPIIYSVTNKRYRNAFKQLFVCKTRPE